MVDVVQLVEHRIVVPSVVGSSPIIHPLKKAGRVPAFCRIPAGPSPGVRRFVHVFGLIPGRVRHYGWLEIKNAPKMILKRRKPGFGIKNGPKMILGRRGTKKDYPKNARMASISALGKAFCSPEERFFRFTVPASISELPQMEMKGMALRSA